MYIYMHFYSVPPRNIRIQSSTILASPLGCLDPFVNLRSLSIDFSPDGLATQHTRAKHIFSGSSSAGIMFPSCLESLTLTSLSRIDVPLLKIIVACFPHLITLSLSCTERLDLDCCWGCFEESASAIVHSPIPGMFSTSADLAVSAPMQFQSHNFVKILSSVIPQLFITR